MIKKYSQFELLDEGFWDKFTTSPIIRGMAATTKGVGKTLQTVLPELTKPFEDASKAGKDIGSTIAQGWRGTVGNIRKSLNDSGYDIDGGIKKNGKNYIVRIAPIEFDSRGTKITPTSSDWKTVVVDKNGSRVGLARSKTKGVVHSGGKKSKKTKSTNEPTPSYSIAIPPPTAPTPPTTLHHSSQ